MSAKMKIRELLEELYPKRNEERPVCTCGTFDLNHDCVREGFINIAHSAILQEFLSWLPEEKHSGTSYDYGQIQEQGFNQCLAQIKERIKEEGR